MNKHRDNAALKGGAAAHLAEESNSNENPGAESATVQRDFYVRARKICSDLFEPNPAWYWADFLLSVFTAYGLASVFLELSLTSPIAWICFFPACVLVYRASLFVHEIVHFPRNEMKAFRWVWNFLAGAPMMVPSFSYESHTHHHSSRHYGTEHDGEYLPLASGTLSGIFVFMAQVFFQPLLVFLRYLIGPLSFLHPILRQWTLTHASSLVINFKYHKDADQVKHSREDTFWEVMTYVRVWAMVAVVVFGIMPWTRLPKMLLIAMFVLTLNHIRTLAAHRYRSQGETISHLEQFQDSTNITGKWYTELICPVGLRYHALHHLFPGIPYHNLGTAHRRLMSELPEGSIYHQSVYPGFRSVIGELVETVRKPHEERDIVGRQA
ncbi:MAG: fatty acid desaturase [Planctomycetota bacterium]